MMYRSILLCAALLLLPSGVAVGEQLDPERLLYRLENMQANYDDEAINAFVDGDAVVEVYQMSGVRFWWLEKPGVLNKDGASVLALLRKASHYGLPAADYIADIEVLLEGNFTRRPTVSLELLLTDRFLIFLEHLKNGRLDPESLKPRTQVSTAVKTQFMNAVSNAEFDAAVLSQTFEPQYAVYSLLKAELARLNAEGNNSEPTERIKTMLKPGGDHPDVVAVKRLLRQFGYFQSDDDSSLFTPQLKASVQRFQREHSLDDDGVIGPASRALLTSLANGDKGALLANMERWRWSPETFGSDYITVNIANFSLKVFTQGKQALEMRTIVGRNYRKTPLISKNMTYFVLNPSWTLPPTILRKDILPKLRKNPNYLNEMDMILYQGWGATQTILDPLTIDWHAVSERSFPYHIRQQPGAKNALGKVKFIFPNEHHIYLHDTNDHGLFSKSQRALSSGCIRVSQPLELMQHITQHYTKSTLSAVEAQLQSGKETTVLLSRPLPVHIQYWTAWVDDERRIHYRHDIYDRDNAIVANLTSPLQEK